MSDRAMELRHLALADRHIVEGEGRVRDMQMAIFRAASLGSDTAQACETLALVADCLAQVKSHRLLIVQAIEDIDASSRYVANQRSVDERSDADAPGREWVGKKP